YDLFGKAWLGCPMHTVLLDREALPDCNGNQQSDLADVFLGTSADCGPNLVPDECDPDCDANGVPDDCDIGSGTHQDCNDNGLPPFTHLQEAVDAATDGDTILIAEGVYEGFTIDDKALNLVAVPNQFVRIEGTVTVLNLAVQRTVLLSRIDVQGISHPGVSDT